MNQSTLARKFSIISGLSILIMFFASIFSFGVVFGSVYIENDPTQTLLNIEAAGISFTLGNLSWIIVLITDFIVSVGIYYVLRTNSKHYALLAGGSRLIYSVILAVAISFSFAKDLSTFYLIFNVGLITFGFHLVLTGLAFIKCTPMWKIVSITLIIAGISYSLISGIYVLLPTYTSVADTINLVMMIPMTLAELALAIWLLVKGGKSTSTMTSSQLPDVA